MNERGPHETLLTDERALSLCADAERGLSRQACAHLNGISPATLGGWLRRGQLASREQPYYDFARCFLRGEARAEAKMTGVLFDDAQTNKNPKSALEWLTRRRRSAWKSVTETRRKTDTKEADRIAKMTEAELEEELKREVETIKQEMGLT